MKHSIPPLLLAAAAALCLYGCSQAAGQEGPETVTGFALDTTVSITIYGGTDGLGDQCLNLCSDYEKLFSRTLEGSDIYRINHAGGEPVEVSDDTASLLLAALSYSELSDGAFDCAIAPVSSLWDFKNNEGTVPNPEDIAAAAALVDYHLIDLDGNTVTLLDPDAALDLGGIAKGYIADRLADLLAREGVSGAVINLGGNVLTLGEKPNGSPWNIAIQKPFGEQNEAIDSVSIEGSGSVVTSGTYERYFYANGTLYHHLLDPETGWPVENDLSSVTILSEHSVDGDALSTICFVLGYEKGAELIRSLEEPGLTAIFIFDDGTIQRVTAEENPDAAQ